MRKLLVLGAGVYQLPVIQRARQMGLEVVVCSRPGPYPGLEEADRFHPVDTTDRERCLEVAHREKVDGVLSPGSDVAMVTLGTIADALGLPGPSAAAALTASDKGAMKAAFEASGVPTPAARLVDSLEHASGVADTIGWPLMLKVVDSSGSRGVIRVDDPDALPSAYQSCRAATRARHLLVEQHIEGEEFGAQAFVLDGKLVFTMPHGDVIRTTSRASVPVGHYVPFELTANVERQVHSAVEACVAALGVDNCALNFDFMLRGQELFVLEVGARSGATCLAEMVSAHYGVDYYEFMIRAALGERPAAPFSPGRAVAASLLISDRAGVLARTPIHPTDGDITEFRFDYALGDHIPRFEVGPDRVGHVVVTGPSVEHARSRLDSILTNVHLEFVPEER